MNKTSKSKLHWRLLRWGLIVLAAFVTLAGALVTEENWRGKRAWENYQREAAARGERVDLASVIPPAVPDDRNFYSAPIVAEAFERLRHADIEASPSPDFRMNFNIYRGDSKLWPEHGGNWMTGTLTDLAEWQLYFQKLGESAAGKTNGFPVPAAPQSPAADVLTALAVFNPALEELRQAAQRPAARMPLDYENGFQTIGELLPWLAELKRCAQFLNLRILAEEQTGQSEAALADVKLFFRLSDSLRPEPFLIEHLVCVAMVAINLQAVYEGLAQHCWNEAQLAELERALAGQDFLADGLTALRGETIFTLEAFENQRLTRKMQFVSNEGGNTQTNTTSLRWMPAAFFYQNKLCFAQMHDRYATRLLDATNRIISPAVLKQVNAEIKQQAKHYSPYSVQALMTLPALTAAVSKFSRIQSQLDLARVACALERFKLAHGNYPVTLDVLSPQFLEKIPHDIINGQPLHYRPTEGGKFVVYSVGWDEKDDGGKIILDKNGRVDRDHGDWVWKN
jgi:hypothetical protein